MYSCPLFLISSAYVRFFCPLSSPSLHDRNGMDLTDAEDIKKRGQEYTGELYKKELHDRDNHDGVITHLGPDLDVKSSGP